VQITNGLFTTQTVVSLSKYTSKWRIGSITETHYLNIGCQWTK